MELFFSYFFYFQFASHAALMFNTDFSSCAFVFVILGFIRQKKNLLKAKHKKYVNFFIFFIFRNWFKFSKREIKLKVLNIKQFSSIDTCLNFLFILPSQKVYYIFLYTPAVRFIFFIFFSSIIKYNNLNHYCGKGE